MNAASAGHLPATRASGHGLLDILLSQPRVHDSVAKPLEELRRVLVAGPTEDGTFLSVLLRTRGQRLEPFKDALLCLAAQSDQSFEVIVIDHNSELEGAEAVRRIVASQPQSFRERVRIVEVVGGTRGRPLNEGIQVAKGEYIAVFDDDDLLFADWVEQFHAAEPAAGGRLLRSQVATQKAAPEVWNEGISGYRTLSWPNAEYARTFDQLAHLQANNSPFMSIAFPHVLFTRMGLTFDEELVVCEDWDLILRGSLLLGVEDVPALTAIYRRWQTASTSYTEHSKAQWAEAEKRVIDRLNDSVILLPPGTVLKIRDLLASDEADAKLKLVTGSRSWKVTAPLRAAVIKANTVRWHIHRLLGRS